jgi:hypothetical protein
MEKKDCLKIISISNLEINNWNYPSEKQLELAQCKKESLNQTMTPLARAEQQDRTLIGRKGRKYY